jgi:type VI protein secretion system component VasK
MESNGIKALADKWTSAIAIAVMLISLGTWTGILQYKTDANASGLESNIQGDKERAAEQDAAIEKLRDEISELNKGVSELNGYLKAITRRLNE